MFNLSQFSSTPFSGVGKNGIPIYCTASMRMTVSGGFYVFRAVTAVALFRAEAYGQMICIRPAAGEASMHMCTEEPAYGLSSDIVCKYADVCFCVWVSHIRHQGTGV